MLKLIQSFSTPLLKKNVIPVANSIAARSIYDINFDSEEEIIKNIFGKVLMIGINIPDTKNLLTETALKKILGLIENFHEDEKMCAAVLHGCGGNFCSGTVSSNEALKLSESILIRLNELKKPIIGSLDGYVTNFGLYLAAMCDMRVLDSSGVMGFSNKTQELECPLFLYERLLLTIGLSRTIELLCTRTMWSAKTCFENGLTDSIADSGCALGKAILLGQAVGFHRPLENVLKDREKIFSFLKTKV